MLNKTIKHFTKGIITAIEDYSIPDGSYSNMLNFVTQGDKVELRRGSLLLGTELTGTGESYIHTAYKNDGTEVLYRVRDLMIEYYDTTTEDWIEIGTNILPTSVVLSDICFGNYKTISGSMLFIGSPKFMYKLLPDAIGSYDDMDGYKGLFKVERNRMFLWGKEADPANLYLSWIDALTTKIDATTGVITDEAIGALGSKDYTGTLAFKAGNAKAHCFALTFTDGTETFTDNRDGTLTGSAGGTGTINYISGVYSISFNATTTVAVTADYIYDDQSSDGIYDFTYSATRVAGEGDVQLQGSGGDLKSVEFYNDVAYCFHERNIWSLTLGIDDTTATNEIYRNNIGVQHWGNTYASGIGIYFIDSEGEKNFRLLTTASGSTEVIPTTISDVLNIDDYTFDKARMIEFEDYLLIACRTTTNNNRVFAYNKKWNSYDLWEYFVGNFAKYDSALHIGDSGSDNVYEILSGLDDDESSVNGFVEFNLSDLDVAELKKVRHLILEGATGKDQISKVYASIDHGTYVEIGTIDGSGDYVDDGTPIDVGSTTIGKNEIGGGGSGILAYHYIKKIRFSVDKFERCKIKVEPTKLGWLDVSEIRFRDIQRYGNKLPTRYR